jgi:hypothetical protein
MDTVAMGAFGDQIGGLLLRWLDNDDIQARLQAKSALATNAARRIKTPILRCNAAAHHVLEYLKHQRCSGCGGRKQKISLTGVYEACLQCNATGLTGHPPLHWGKLPHSILRDAQARMGSYLAAAREG